MILNWTLECHVTKSYWYDLRIGGQLAGRGSVVQEGKRQS